MINSLLMLKVPFERIFSACYAEVMRGFVRVIMVMGSSVKVRELLNSNVYFLQLEIVVY